MTSVEKELADPANVTRDKLVLSIPLTENSAEVNNIVVQNISLHSTKDTPDMTTLEIACSGAVGTTSGGSTDSNSSSTIHGSTKTSATTLGGTKMAATTLGGTKITATTLGGTKTAATTLGGTKTTATTLGGTKTTATTLGGTKTASNTLGGTKTATTTLGGTKTTATTLGGTKTTATTLGGTKTTVTTLGGTKTAATTIGSTKKTATTLGGTKTTATTLVLKSLPEASSAELPITKTSSSGVSEPKNPAISKKQAQIELLAQKLRKQKEDRDRLRQLENERVKRDRELERQAEKLQLEKKLLLEKERSQRQAVIKSQIKIVDEEKKKKELAEHRLNLLSRFQGVYVSGLRDPSTQPRPAKKAASKSKAKAKYPSNADQQEVHVSTESHPPPSNNELVQEPTTAHDKFDNLSPLVDQKTLQSPSLELQESSPSVQTSAQNTSIPSQNLSLTLDEKPLDPTPSKAHDEPETYVKESWEEETDEDEPQEPPVSTTSTSSISLIKDDKVRIAEAQPIACDTETVVSTDKVERPLRSPIVCVLGHVDTGKTKLLDKMRRTNVQDGEVGGITQQIGATFFPLEDIKKLTQDLLKESNKFKVPGLLVIDTPGHSSFSNLRTRGSSLCDIAILVVDIMHGLEPMTLQSIEMLRQRRTPFVVALNKVDRIYEWRPFPNKPIQYSLKMQMKHVLSEYEDRIKSAINEFAGQGLNAELYYKIKSLKDFSRNVAIIPTSAHTGEGIPDLIAFVVQLTQRMMKQQLISKDELQCTVLEVKVLEGFGSTIDVILANGTLHQGDRFVVGGFNGPIVTTIKALLTPPPMRELRVENNYQHHSFLHASHGFKIAANKLEKAIAGSQLIVYKSEEELEEIEKQVMQPLELLRQKVHKTNEGVYIQASTLGSLEALLDFLTVDCKIPISNFGIGPIHEIDVKKASVMQERSPDYACILAFDVKITPNAQELAQKYKLKIFHADVIYHLEKQFKDYIDELRNQERQKLKSEIIYPCTLSIKPDGLFHASNPIILGVKVECGMLRVETPLCFWSQSHEDWIIIGRVSKIERDNKVIKEINKNEEGAIEIVATDANYMFGRHFSYQDQLHSKITRKSIDALKQFDKGFLNHPENYHLVVDLKKKFSI